VGAGLGATATEVFEGAAVVEAVLEEVDDLFVGDVDYGGALVEEAANVLAEGLALFLLDHGQVHASTRSAHGAREVAGELLLQLAHLSIECLSNDSSHVSGAWSRQKGK
jgi:hypothetical protein